MMNLFQKTVILASVILSTASGFLEEGADRSRRELSLSNSLCGTRAIHAEIAITFVGVIISGGNVDVSPNTVLSGTYSLTDGELADTADTAPFTADAVQAWQEAMTPRDDALPILIPQIGGSLYTPGTYRGGTISIGDGLTVTLDGEGDPNSKFLFQANSTMIVGAGCKIVLINEAKAENVVWALGTLFTTSAGTDFKGTIMAGTAVTFEAGTVIEGSILALSAITFGPENKVNNGCVVALTELTFGTMNSVTFVPYHLIPAVIDFPAPLANDNDEFVIACLPLLTDAPPDVCDDFPTSIDAAMQETLNTCTTQGINNAIMARRAMRRVGEIDIPQLEEGEMAIVPTAATPLDEAGGGQEAHNLRGARQEGRRLVHNWCHVDSPDYLIILICCMDTNSYSYCGSPKSEDRRRALTAADGEPLLSAEVELYLPFISDTCTSQFQALADAYLDINAEATCFGADANNVANLKCYAIFVTGGAEEDEQSEVY